MFLTSISTPRTSARTWTPTTGTSFNVNDFDEAYVGPFSWALKRLAASLARPGSYRVKDVVGRRGIGIGSAGLPSYNILLEGNSDALENDVVIYMKQAQTCCGVPTLNQTGELKLKIWCRRA